MPVTRQQLDSIIEQLSIWFPKTFFVFQGKRKPLKVGIDKDLEKIVVDASVRKLMRLAIPYYVRELGYQKSIKLGAARVDLNGNAAGLVTEKQVEMSKEMIATIRARRQKKKEEDAKPKEKPRPPPPPAPKKDGLEAQKEAARRRKAQAEGRVA